MKYKLIDKQGGGLKEHKIYNSKDEVRKDLQDFHSADVEGASTMRLETLLDIGDWELVETPEKATNGELDNL